MLVNVSEKGEFDFDKVIGLCKNQKEKDDFLNFILFSLAVYKYFNLKFWWGKGLYGKFSENERKRINVFLGILRKDLNLKISDKSLSSVRAKNIFENYFKQQEEGKKGLGSKYEELSLEYALSQVFSPKQKNLFLKKFKGEMMTKTEREYYSRKVKKKVIALANSELHKLARRIFES